MQNMKRVLGAVTLRWLDQTITSFALIASFAGGNLSGLRLLLVLGLGNLLGDAVSMALGDFTSERSEQQFLLSEYASEAWEVDNHFPGVVNERRNLYRQAGLSDDDADALVNILAKYPKTVFLDTMFTQELGLIPPAESQKPLITNNTHDEHQHHQSHASPSIRDSSDAPAWKKALVTLTSFLLFGSVPLIAYIPMWAFIQSQLAFVLTIPIEAVTLFVLGVIKSVSARQKWWRGGAELLLVGGIAASIAFATGYGIEMALPSSWSS
jgi:VIT1/CCC1 family predicted Fe2+/Mn2+ transporter